MFAISGGPARQGTAQETAKAAQVDIARAKSPLPSDSPGQAAVASWCFRRRLRGVISITRVLHFSSIAGGVREGWSSVGGFQEEQRVLLLSGHRKGLRPGTRVPARRRAYARLWIHPSRPNRLIQELVHADLCGRRVCEICNDAPPRTDDGSDESHSDRDRSESSHGSSGTFGSIISPPAEVRQSWAIAHA